MNILYLCGSNRDREYVMQRYAYDNQALIERVEHDRKVIRMKNGITLFFQTYSNPDRLRGMEFGMVLRDHQRIEATMHQQHETEELVRAQLR